MQMKLKDNPNFKSNLNTIQDPILKHKWSKSNVNKV